MKNNRDLLHRWPVVGLIRIACYGTLVALAIMVFSVLVPTALPVMLAMSVGHALGTLAFACYVLAVLTDTARGTQVATKQDKVAKEPSP